MVTFGAPPAGFCMIDVTPWQSDGGVGRGSTTAAGGWESQATKGFSVGLCRYVLQVPRRQYFVLDGGDGQAPIPPEQYIIRITVNPPFTAAQLSVSPHGT